MKKADIIQRSANPNCWTYGVPALNVKWHPWLPDIERKYRLRADHEFGMDELFWDWVDKIDARGDGWDYPTGEFHAAQEMAAEDGWEQAKEHAEEIWTEHWMGTPKIYSDGRSGGWLVAHDLPDVENWDAIAVGRWAKFARCVQATLDDLDYQFVWHLHVNVYENEPDYNPDAGFQLTLEDA
jgi:hypothetical protein